MTFPDDAKQFLLRIFADMTEDEREGALEALAEHYCMYCGFAYTERNPICYCRADD